ncbi:hypothetical protein HOI26_02865 [Candidatus Woesearchaeota archaeon]|nr:hypothetical protein [Candidatus Woesearchaeota archaeon]
MYIEKRGFFVMFVVLAMIVVISGFLFLEGGITGAVVSEEITISVPIENITNNKSIEIVNDTTVENTTIVLPNDFLKDNLILNDTTKDFLDNVEIDLTPQFNLGLQIDANSTQCGYVNESITLTTNVNSSGTCFNINVSDTTLDCAGYNINYSTAGVFGYGINNTGFSNVTIKNCNIFEENITTSSKHAIFYSNSVNGTIQNNTIINEGSTSNLSNGIRFNFVNNTLVIDNVINITSEYNNAVHLSDSYSNNLTSNIITGNHTFVFTGTVAIPMDGIYLDDSDSSIINHNQITMYGNYENGALDLISTFYTLIDNNTIITYGNTSHGIDGSLSRYNNITNNNITTYGDFSAGVLPGLLSHYYNMINNTITSYEYYALDSAASWNHAINFNSIRGYSNTFDAIRLAAGNFTGNNISTNGSSAYGLTISTSLHSYFWNNSFNTTNAPFYFDPNVDYSNYNHTIDTTNTYQEESIYYLFENYSDIIENTENISFLAIINSSNINVTNVTFDKQGIKLIVTDNIIIENSSVLGLPKVSISILNTSYAIIRNNNISNSGESGVNVTKSSNNNFESNYLFNNSIGYYIGENSQNNNFTNEQIINHSRGILIDALVTTISDNTFENPTFQDNTFDVYIENTVGSISFVNYTVNTSKFIVNDLMQVFYKWYVDVNVTDTSQNALANATVKAYNSIGDLEDTILTNSSGLSRLKITEYYTYNNVTYYIVPAEITASKANYTQNNTSVNLLNLTYAQANLTLTAINCGATLTNDFNFGSNYNCNNAFIIGTDGITINGNGYNLTGDNSGNGINSSGRVNVSVINLEISNFTQGIYFYNTNNSNLSGVTIINNTDGVIFNNSNNSKVLDGIFNNNTFDIYVNGNTSNYLINYTGDLNNITTENDAQVFSQWYVTVNANYTDNDGNVKNLPGAEASGYFNSSGILDYTQSTDSNGQARLLLSELKKNSTGTYYLTPHNVTLSFSTIPGTDINSTSINLTQTNNTNVSMNLDLDCFVPYTDMQIYEDTTFCPGSFTAHSIYLQLNSSLTCVNTVLSQEQQSIRYSRFGIYSGGNYNNAITGCNLSDYKGGGIFINSGGNVTISNVNVETSADSNSLGIKVTGTTGNFLLENSNMVSYSDVSLVDLSGVEGVNITNNSFEKSVTSAGSGEGILLSNVDNGVISNNSFNRLNRAIWLHSSSTSNNFYYNNFSNNTYHYYYYNQTGGGNEFNTSVAGYPQGNAYADYCDMGTDENGDGYADNTSAADEWPYSENISSKIFDPTNDNAGVIDYGPLIQECPAAVVFLGSTSSSGSSSTDSGSGGSLPPAASAPSTATTANPSSFYSPSDAKKFLTSQSEVDFDQFGTKIKFTLENTGDKTMLLLPQLLQDYDDPFFIITRKTLGFEDSLFDQMSGMAYSENTISGRLLNARIKNDERIVLEPGEKKETVIEIDEDFKIPRQIKVQFTTLGEVVYEEEVQQKAFSGTAIDLDSENNLMDLYVVIVPLTEELEEYYAGNGITGAAVAEPPKKSDEYFLEFTINQDGSSFGDLYGPYKIKEDQSLVFAQQLKYNSEKYSGTNTVQTKIYRGGDVIVEDEFEMNFGSGKKTSKFSGFLIILPFILALVLLSIILFRRTKHLNEKL